MGVKVAGSCIAGAALFDAVRFLMQVAGLRALRNRHPELFDGAKAREAVEACITDYRKLS